MAWSTKKHLTGFTLVEALLAVAILMLLAVGSVAANRLTTSGIKISQLRSRANLLADEAMGAVMSIKLEDFSAIKLGTYHPVHNGSKWTLVAGSENIGGLTRSVTFSPVMRGLSCFTMVCDIVSQGGIVDTNSYFVKVTVSWTESGQTDGLVLDSLITYWR